ncbi:MAG: hypothetical protein ACUVUF_05725 [Candidatus Bathycorpusculaceae bacterium]
MGDVLDVPYPKVVAKLQDPVKRNIKLVKNLLSRKKTLHPRHFWIASIKRSFQQCKEDVIGTVCLLAGFLCESMRYDSTAKIYITKLSESAYNISPHLQIKVILDADVDTTAFYSTTTEDLFNYEYLAIGVITEYEGQPAVRCYGLIAIDEIPKAVRRIWNQN